MFPDSFVYYHNVCPCIETHGAGITICHSHNKEFTERNIKTAGGIEAMIHIYSQCALTLQEYQETHDLEDWELRVITQEINQDRAAIRQLNRMKES